jgi:hypothetical protein
MRLLQILSNTIPDPMWPTIARTTPMQAKMQMMINTVVIAEGFPATGMKNRQSGSPAGR